MKDQIRNYIVRYTWYRFFHNGQIENEEERECRVESYSAEDAYFQVKLELDKRCSGSSYGNGQPTYGFSIALIKPKSICEWPECKDEALCSSGNVNGALVCKDHFKITNGKSIDELSADELRTMEAIWMEQEKKKLIVFS